MHLRVIGLALAVAACGAAASSAQEAKPETQPDTKVDAKPDARVPTPVLPDMSGGWRLDREHSEVPPARAQVGGPNDRGEGEGGRRGWGGGRGGRGGMGGFGGGMGGRGGGMGGGGYNRPSPEEREAMRDTLSSAVTPAEKVNISQSPQEITLLNEDGTLLRLVPDGRKVKLDGGLERKTRWEEGRLVEEAKVSTLKVNRTYTLTQTDAGRQLTVTGRVDNQLRREPITFRYVYVPIEVPAAPTP